MVPEIVRQSLIKKDPKGDPNFENWPGLGGSRRALPACVRLGFWGVLVSSG